jgi:ABC-type nitrate/sulfonate/bicarbonate transport system substrate-binding protein
VSGELLPVHIVDAGGTHELVTIALMRSQGFLENVGLTYERTLVTNGAEAVEELLSGTGDVAMQIGFGPALKAIAKGAPLKVVAASNLLTVHAVYTRDPDIRRMRDLVGRRVGVGAYGALTHQLMYAALTKQGVDPAGVNFVHMGNSASIFQALLRGELDAGFGETEVFDHQAEYGVHHLEDAVLWRELTDFPNQASFATEAAIRDKREALVRTLQGHAGFYRYLQGATSWETFAAARETALPGSEPAESKVQWDWYREFQPFAEDLILPRDRFDYMQALNIRMGLQAQALPFDVVCDMSLAGEAVQRLDAAPAPQGKPAHV